MNREKNKIFKEEAMKRKSLMLLGFLGISFFLLLMIFAPWGERTLSANVGTEAGIVLTNVAELDWLGATAAESVTNIDHTVGVNYGAKWIGEGDGTVVAGNMKVMETYFTNLGNADADYEFKSEILDDESSLAWTTTFSNFTDGGAEGATLMVAGISRGAVKQIRFNVDVPSAETNLAYMQFRLIASNEDAANLNATNYTGLNGIVYGGDMGLYGAAPGHVWMHNTNENDRQWTLTVEAPVLYLTMAAGFANPEPYQLEATPVPGALITYRLFYTNAGDAGATEVTLIGNVPDNTTYSNESIVRGATGAPQTVGDYGDGGNVGLADAQDGGDEAWYNAGGPRVEIYPGGTDTDNTSGTVASAASRNYFYRVTLD
jgi:uncharacterized repeat protein (TIGR01451 family)